MKTCEQCNEAKELTEFNKNGTGYRKICKVCLYGTDTTGLYKCTKLRTNKSKPSCGLYKARDEFEEVSKGKYKSLCKVCDTYVTDIKLCNNCGDNKPTSEFDKYSDTKYLANCKQCAIDIREIYLLTVPDIIECNHCKCKLPKEFYKFKGDILNVNCRGCLGENEYIKKNCMCCKMPKFIHEYDMSLSDRKRICRDCRGVHIEGVNLLCSKCDYYEPLSSYLKGKKCEYCRAKERKVEGGYKCIHGNRKNRCNEGCNEIKICKVHGSGTGLWINCNDCKKIGYCEHDVRKRDCPLCPDATGRCPCGNRRRVCKTCKGACICKHGKIKYNCEECPGGCKNKCPCGIRKTFCMKHGGGGLCFHGKPRTFCNECSNQVCEHGIIKYSCKYCDPLRYIASQLRCKINIAICQGRYEYEPEHLGCNIDIFMSHIEEQFKEGMDWYNHGEWHIDHIVPIMYKDTTNEVLTESIIIERLHYINTQPLWAIDNIVKGNRFIG
jgi:hypothetical protein